MSRDNLANRHRHVPQLVRINLVNRTVDISIPVCVFMWVHIFCHVLRAQPLQLSY